MNKWVKWGLLVGAGLVGLFVAALVTVSLLVDVDDLKPQVEKAVASATGRTFTMGDDLDLSIFPWIGVALSDVQLGNAAGFTGPSLAQVEAVEVRLRFWPLLSKKIEAKRIFIKRPRIVLEKNKKGVGNWEDIGAAGPKPEEPAGPKSSSESAGPLLADVQIAEFAIVDGTVLWIDAVNDVRQEVSKLNLTLRDISFTRPMAVNFMTLINQQPVSLEGQIGPTGTEPGKQPIPFDLAISALRQFNVRFKGQLDSVLTAPQINLQVDAEPFSPRKLLAALNIPMPVQTTDPKVLEKVALNVAIAASPQAVSLSNGALQLDDSKVTFDVKASEFVKPNLAAAVVLDQIDLDRYLPAKDNAAQGETPKPPATQKATQSEPIDYQPLRRMIVDAKLKIGSLKANGARVKDVDVHLSGKDGVFDLKTLAVKLYQGALNGSGQVDVRGKRPKSRITLNTDGVRVGPLLSDVLQKDFIEGTTKAAVSLSMTGDTPEMIKKTLSGKGDLLFTDGAIKGVDLAGMIRNAQAALGLAQKVTEKPRTDFSELHCPFTIDRGRFKTPQSGLKSPLLRLLAVGQAHLVDETLDFRIEPRLVATIVGQGDTQKRTGLQVPLIVSGTFTKPSIKPDLKAMVQKGLTDPQRVSEILGDKKAAEPIGNILKGAQQFLGAPQSGTQPEGDPPPEKKAAEEPVKKAIEGFMKGFPFGGKQ